MKKLLLILSLILIPQICLYAPPTRTYTYTTGNVIDPSQNTTNEDNIFNYLTTGVDTYADGTIVSADILDGTIVNADISGSAAVGYSKLNLTGNILNADISSSAAIVDTKLAQITTASKVDGSALTGTATLTGLTTGGLTASANLDIGSYELRAQTFN